MERPKTSTSTERTKPSSYMIRPKSATRRPLHRSTSCSSSVRTSSPSGSELPPELDISSVSAISTLSRHDATRKTIDGASRLAQLGKYKADKELRELAYDILEAKALILEAELTWAPPPDLLESQTKNKEIKKKIAENINEIEEFLEFCPRLSVLLQAQSASDETQKYLDSVAIPSPDHIKTLEDLVSLLKRTQLVEDSILLPKGDELKMLKPQLERLFSNEEQRAVEIAKKYAENMAKLTENIKNIEVASNKLILIEKEKEMWERHAISLEESLELGKIWLEEHRHDSNSL